MHKFVDEVLIRVQAGKGGAGEVSFLREKFIEFGGPDGGDGGDGGDVIFTTSEQLLALSHIRPEQVYRARNGFPGEGSNCHGKKGADLVIRVPFGTQIIDPHTADGVYVAYQYLEQDVPMIVLETAQAAKFEDTIQEALGTKPPRPDATQNIEDLPQRVFNLPNDAQAIKQFIHEHA